MVHESMSPWRQQFENYHLSNTAPLRLAVLQSESTPIMNYGHHVRDLLLELKRSEEALVTASASGGTQPEIAKLATVAIPSYNDNSVRMALQDFSLHVQALQEQAIAAAAATTTATDGDGGNSSTGKPSLTVRPSIVLQMSRVSEINVDYCFIMSYGCSVYRSCYTGKVELVRRVEIF
jgi:hypothetical protein